MRREEADLARRDRANDDIVRLVTLGILFACDFAFLQEGAAMALLVIWACFVSAACWWRATAPMRLRTLPLYAAATWLVTVFAALVVAPA